MKRAMREIGVPIFYSGATILGAMLILFFAKFADYRNFAPTFGTAVFIVMLASVTLIPALFTLFGRSAFWPKIPRVGDEHMKSHSLWGNIARFVTTKPIVSVAVVGTFLLLSASHIFTMTYEFDTMKSFPDDMPSIEGYEILETKFEKGDLAPTTVLFESKDPLTPELQTQVEETLTEHSTVPELLIRGLSDDEKVIAYTVTFTTGPYAIESIDRKSVV